MYMDKAHDGRFCLKNALNNALQAAEYDVEALLQHALTWVTRMLPTNSAQINEFRKIFDEDNGFCDVVVAIEALKEMGKGLVEVPQNVLACAQQEISDATFLVNLWDTHWVTI